MRKSFGYMLPEGLPRACDWCTQIITKDQNAKNVLMDCKPFSQLHKMRAYGVIYQIICLKCYNWSAKHEGLEENQDSLVKRWEKDVARWMKGDEDLQ